MACSILRCPLTCTARLGQGINMLCYFTCPFGPLDKQREQGHGTDVSTLHGAWVGLCLSYDSPERRKPSQSVCNWFGPHKSVSQCRFWLGLLMLLNVWSVIVVVSQTQESMNLQFLLQGLMWKQSYLRENAGVEGFRPRGYCPVNPV